MRLEVRPNLYMLKVLTWLQVVKELKEEKQMRWKAEDELGWSSPEWVELMFVL